MALKCSALSSWLVNTLSPASAGKEGVTVSRWPGSPGRGWGGLVPGVLMDDRPEPVLISFPSVLTSDWATHPRCKTEQHKRTYLRFKIKIITGSSVNEQIYGVSSRTLSFSFYTQSILV